MARAGSPARAIVYLGEGVRASGGPGMPRYQLPQRGLGGGSGGGSRRAAALSRAP